MEMATVKKILVIGSFMTDLVVQTDKVPVEGETVIGNSFNQFTGGKGANQAVAAARLGGNVEMIGKLGKDDFGREHVRSLQNAGIIHDHVLYDNVAASGIGNVTLDSHGNNRIIVIPGANLKLTEQDIDKIEDVIQQSDIVVLQLEIPMQTVYRAIDLAHKHGKKAILNPAPAQPIDLSYANKIDYVTPNETEAYILTGIEVNNLEKTRKAANKLLSQGYKNVIITLGEKGVFFKNQYEEKSFPAYKVKPVDTTAAGDSFVGAFAYGLSAGWNENQAIKFAVATSAITVTRMGSQPSLPKKEEVQQFLRDREIAAGV